MLGFLFVAVMIVQSSTGLSDMGMVSFFHMGGLMSNVNKDVSISKQAIIRDTDAGKRFSSSLNVQPHVLSSPEEVYLFSRTKRPFGC